MEDRLVDPQEWQCDLQTVYAGYMGHFQREDILWYEQAWGVFYESFDAFLRYGWTVIVVTDTKTNQPHIVTHPFLVHEFVKMIKTRYGATLPKISYNVLFVTPSETSLQRTKIISSALEYKEIHGTLRSVWLAAQKARAISGEPKIIRQLWAMKNRTFLAIDFEWSERDTSKVLEWGYAAVRAGALNAMGAIGWPPSPEENYRRGHYIVGEHVDRIVNKYRPTFPWAYAFGNSQIVSEAQLPRVIGAVISCLSSPNTDTAQNTLVLVGHGIHEDLRRLEELGVDIPRNVVIIDTATYERQLFASGSRKPMKARSGKPRSESSTLPLGKLLESLNVNLGCKLHNAGNDAMMCLLALQLLLEPEGTQMPKYRKPGVDTTLPRVESKRVDTKPEVPMYLFTGVARTMPE